MNGKGQGLHGFSLSVRGKLKMLYLIPTIKGLYASNEICWATIALVFSPRIKSWIFFDKQRLKCAILDIMYGN